MEQIAERRAASHPDYFPPQAHPDTRPLQHSRAKTLPREKNGIFLGLFLPCQSWGQWPTLAKSEAEWTYDYNRRTTLLAEEMGLHFALPAARWKGIAGDSIVWRGVSLDTITLAAALLEATSRITVMATMHTNVFNAVVAAKICADLDQISNGRFALNVVSGWNEDEFKSLSIPLIEGRKDRYAYTREWLEVVRILWRDGECTFKGNYLRFEGAVARPQPVQTPGPLLVNAGQSFTGMSFAAEHADYLFSYGLNAEKFRSLAADKKSETGFVGLKKLLIRKTQAEAEAVAEEIFQNVDRKAVAGMRVASGAGTPETVHEWVSDETNLRAALFEDGFIGSPENIAKALAEWVIRTRPDGICLTLFDYLRELELFAEVLPIMSDMLAKDGMHIVAPPPATVRSRI